LPKELEDVFDDVLNEIKKGSEYQDYLELEQKMLQNQEIQDLICSIKKLQKQLVKLEYERKDTTEVNLEYQKNLELLNAFPLYVAFVEKQRQVNEVLQDVKFQIEDFFEQLIQEGL